MQVESNRRQIWGLNGAGWKEKGGDGKGWRVDLAEEGGSAGTHKILTPFLGLIYFHRSTSRSMAAIGAYVVAREHSEEASTFRNSFAGFLGTPCWHLCVTTWKVTVDWAACPLSEGSDIGDGPEEYIYIYLYIELPDSSRICTASE